jgi:hypothetical protein
MVVAQVKETPPSAKQLKLGADQLETTLLTLIEHGLGDGVNGAGSRALELALAEIRKTRENADTNQPLGAEHLARAHLAVHAVIEQLPRWWRWSQPGPWLLAYLLLVAFLVLNLATGWRPRFAAGWFPELAESIWDVPTAALGWGALGSTLSSLYWLTRQLARRIFRPSFAYHHAAAPLIGALFGGFIYLLFQAGMVALQTGAVDEGTGPLSETSAAAPLPYAMAALAFLAGFKWEIVLAWVRNFRLGNAGGDGPTPGGT